MEHPRLFEDDRGPAAREQARAAAEKHGHKLSELLEVQAKGAAYAATAGCTHCGYGVTVLVRDGVIEVVGDAASASCKDLATWR